MILSNVIEKIIAFIQNVILTPIATLLQDIYDSAVNVAMSVQPPQNVLDFSGACIKLFVPYRQIGVALAIIIPVMILNLVVAVVLRVKSFVPTMGGK